MPLPQPIPQPFCQKVLPAVFSDSFSYYEDLCKLTEYINQVITFAQALQVQVNNIATDLASNYETKNNITNNRKLSPTGNFTGTIQGYSSVCLIESLADSLTLSKKLIDDINHRLAIGYFVDCGDFTETDPPTQKFDCGEFYTMRVIETYAVNCVRPDFEVGGY